MKQRGFGWPWLLGAAALLLAPGCAPNDPLEGRIEAADYVGMSMWRADLGSRLEPAELADLDLALQEIRYQVMAEGMSGSEAVEAGLIEKVHGKSVRDILLSGLRARLARVEREEMSIRLALPINAASVRRRTGVERLERKAQVEDQVGRLEEDDAEVLRLKARLDAYGDRSSAPGACREPRAAAWAPVSPANARRPSA